MPFCNSSLLNTWVSMPQSPVLWANVFSNTPTSRLSHLTYHIICLLISFASEESNGLAVIVQSSRSFFPTSKWLFQCLMNSLEGWLPKVKFSHQPLSSTPKAGCSHGMHQNGRFDANFYFSSCHCHKNYFANRCYCLDYDYWFWLRETRPLAMKNPFQPHWHTNCSCFDYVVSTIQTTYTVFDILHATDRSDFSIAQLIFGLN